MATQTVTCYHCGIPDLIRSVLSRRADRRSRRWTPACASSFVVVKHLMVVKHPARPAS